MTPKHRLLLLLAAVLAVGLGLDLVDVVWGPWARMHWEELFNARAAAQLACGHWEAAPRLQYRNFCGGCTAEAVGAAPLFGLLGAKVWVWKAMLAVLHLGIAAAGAGVAWRAAGPRAGVAFAALMVGAPGFYRELTHTGWGNHAESALFPLVATLLLVVAGHSRWTRPAWLLAAGGVVGAGLWFCQTSAWSLPVLGLGAVMVGGWLAPLVAGGFPVGFSPWWWFFEDRPNAAEQTVDWWANLEPASPAALLEHLFGDYLRDGLWAASEYGEPGWGAGLWWGLLWIGAAAGVVASLRGVRRAGPDRPARLLAPVGLLTYLVVLILRWDWWKWLPDVYVNEAFNLRYRAPLVPMLFLLLASAVGRRRGGWTLLAGGLAAYGLARRAGTWDGGRPARMWADVYQAAGWPDRTVPTGEPRQQLVRKQGRPQDVRAALDFVAGHEDPLPACARDHRFELGRRSGLALSELAYANPITLAEQAAPLLRDAAERRAWADGYAQALMGEDGRVLNGAPGEVIDQLEMNSPGLGEAVGHAAGRRAAASFRFDGDAAHQPALDPRIWDGVCEWRGIDQMDKRTDGGARSPWSLTDRPDLVEAAGACADTPAFRFGLGVGRARYLGCEQPPVEASELQGFALGCALYR